MTVKLLTKRYLEFLSLKGGCIGSSESTLVEIAHCWKSHVAAHLISAACPGGEEYNVTGEECVRCPVGMYKPGSHEYRFVDCIGCDSGFTTDGDGKTSENDCNIRM